jgi:hypothetical protein
LAFVETYPAAEQPDPERLIATTQRSAIAAKPLQSQPVIAAPTGAAIYPVKVSTNFTISGADAG